MSLDPNIILQAGQGVQQANPLATAAQALGVQNALIQNMGNRQMLAARQAIGPIYQQSIGPDGQLDANKLLAAAAQDPRTAWMAGDLVKQAQDRQAQQVQIQTSQFDLAQKHLEAMTGMLGPLVMNPNATRQDYLNTISTAVEQGLVDPRQAANEIGQMPANDADLQNWGLTHYARYQSMDNQIKAMRGETQTDNLGNREAITQVNKLTGAVTPLATAPLGISPSDAASTVPYTASNGQPMTMSKGEYAGQQPQGGFQAPGAPQALMGNIPTTQPRAPSQMAAHVPPRLPTGLPTGQEDVLKDSAAQGQAALKAASDYRMNVRPMITEAQNLIAQGVLTGPNAKAVNLAGRFASQFGIDVPNTDKADVLQKVLEQVSQRQIAAIGGNPTDAKLLSAQISTPNDKMSNAGLKAALATVEGQGQAQDLLGQAYNHYVNTASQPIPFNQFKVQFAKDINPYVLVLRSLPKADMNKAMEAMTPTQRAQIAKDSNNLDQIAQAIGWQP